ncbi:MAG TPA: hypothetical protein PK467_07640 [Candidatus Wallbacteria bacterium]|nr:hypothetical protein [Candidatus Wallbacteria bacterium]
MNYNFNLKKTLIIFAHELKYMLRDRTTLFMMVLLPIIIYPLISVTSAYMFVKSSQSVKSSKTRIIINRDYGPFTDSLRRYFKKDKINYEIKFAALTTSEIQSLITRNELSAYIACARFRKKNTGLEKFRNNFKIRSFQRQIQRRADRAGKRRKKLQKRARGRQHIPA